MIEHFDKIIIGAGIYGLYAALRCAKRDEKILVLERDASPMGRATFVNQARVHMGYHYPRSLATAKKSASYFARFVNDYSFCINGEFEQIYATSDKYSWTNSREFVAFCKAANIKCCEVSTDNYFNENVCDGAFLCEEYTYDAAMLRDYFLGELVSRKNVILRFAETVVGINKQTGEYEVLTDKGRYISEYVLNATYASTNQIINLLGYDFFSIKYELCEIILCNVCDELKKIGLTVMDGPFFSIMPFGKTGMHSLTAVTFTPHETSYDNLPSFSCQIDCDNCSPYSLNNCNLCKNRPKSAWSYMSALAKKYMLPKLEFKYEKSLYSMKPILKMAEMDDSRPTVIKVLSENPTFVSVLSGKINTIYDLDEVL